MIDDLKKLFAERRLKDEAIYAHVLNEIESGHRRDGLWAKALADSKFNENETKSRYIKLRVQSIKDELDLAQIEESKKSLAENEAKETGDSQRTLDQSYRDARNTYAARKTDSEKVAYTEISPGHAHTEREYSCNNCDYHGQLLLRKTGLLGLKSTMICPKCGNRGVVS